MSLLERVYAFHQELLAERYPNATTLVDQFEISLATARRDIAYLRDRLLAPLAFDNKHNGFYYTESGFSLPFSQSPKITLLLSMLNKFAEEAGLRELPEVQQLEEKLSSLLSADHAQLIRSLYCEWIEVESIDTAVFGAIIDAVTNRRAITIAYTTAGAQLSERTVEPQRLCNYQGRWYLLAYCRLREGLRMFHIARIAHGHVIREKSRQIPDLDKNYLLPSFGIFKGRTPEIAKIAFTGTAAELVRNQRWHRDQHIAATDNGIVLHLPISDYREIAMKVMQYGAQAEVLSPAALRDQVAAEVVAMASLYSAGS